MSPLLAAIFAFLSFPYKLPTQGFWTLNTCPNSWKQNDTIIFRLRTPTFRFHFHDCKRENLELEVMSMALKSSFDCYEYSCSCGHFTSNGHTCVKTPNLYSHCILLTWFQFINSWCNNFWCLWLNPWDNGFIECINFMLCMKPLHQGFIKDNKNHCITNL